MMPKQLMMPPMPEYYRGAGFFSEPSFFGDAGASSSSSPPPPWDETMAYAVQMIHNLHNPATKDQALAILGKSAIRERLAPILWNSRGTVNILLDEITSVYRSLNDILTEKQSTQVCHTLALFQGLAIHPETRYPFMKARIPNYLYPFLESKKTEKPHEFVRVTSLGVIGALLKVEDQRITKFLLESKVFPCCLCCMEVGNNLLTKTVATFIVYKLLATEEGMRYCCAIADRFYAVNHQLRKLVEVLADKEIITRSGIDTARRLVRHIIWIYSRLSESPRVCNGLQKLIPERLRDPSIMSLLQEDAAAKQCLQRVFENVASGGLPEPPSPSIENEILSLGRRRKHGA